MHSIFFSISGPLLPIPLYWHSMVRLGQGQAILGGKSSAAYQTRIYSLTCLNRYCSISILHRELSVPRVSFVAISIPDTVSGCIKAGNHNFKIVHSSMQPNICFALEYSMPVPNTYWGWLLPWFQQQSPLLFWWGWLLWTLYQ